MSVNIPEAVELILRGQLEGIEFFDVHETLEHHYGRDLDEDEVGEVMDSLEVVAKQLLEAVSNSAVTYKTVVERRWPREKLHSALGHAKAAIAYSAWSGVRGGQLYELRHGAWDLLYDVPAGASYNDLPWRKK